MSRRILLESDYNNDELMPVTDGLVCWLDGKDYNGESSVRDRIGEKEFVINNIAYNGASFLYDKTNSVIFAEFNADDKMYDLFDADFTLCFDEKLSMPVIGNTYDYPCSFPRIISFGETSGNSPYQLIYSTTSGPMQFCSSIGAYPVFKNTKVLKDTSKKNIIYVKRGDVVEFYLNGAKYETVSDKKTKTIKLERLTLGNNYLENRTYYGDIYSFKAYNRALTEKEIKQNYLYEQSIDRRVQNKTTLTTGTLFNNIINELKSETANTITKIEFTKTSIPEDKINDAKIVSDGNQDYVNCYAYVEDGTIYVSPEVESCVIYANKDCSQMFLDQNKLMTVEFNNFDTSKVTTFKDFFRRCSSLTALDLSGFDTKLNTSTNHMFAACTSLTQLVLTNFDTSKVTDMYAMFYNDYSLTQLDELANFDTSNVSVMYAMFEKCSNLSGQITIKNPKVSSYGITFSGTSTSSDSKFIVKYIDEDTKAMAEKLVATKSSNSNVFLWEEEKEEDNELTPVMDGLICWLDARDGKVEDTIWKDRMNTYNLPLNNCSFNNGYIEMTTNSSMGNFKFSKDFTYCVSLVSYPNSAYQNIYDHSSHMLWIQPNRNLELNVTSKDCGLIIENSRNIITSVREGDITKIYKEGIYTDSNTKNNNSETTVSLFTRNGAQGLVGKVYSILIYNRALTEEEIQQNYEYEKSVDRRDQTKTTLVTGTSFNSIINELHNEATSIVTKIEFTESAIPKDKIDSAKIVSDGDANYVNCYAYLSDDNATIYVSPEVNDCIIYANKDCSNMFNSQNEIMEIIFNNFNTENVTNMSVMFYKCKALKTLDISEFNVSGVTNMQSMFSACSSIESLDLSKWDTNNIKNMQNLFSGCSSLNYLNISNFNTSKLTYMDACFNGCSSLTTLDVSSFDTSKVTSMQNLFRGCSSLVELDLSNFDTSSVTTMSSMFQGCSSLINLDISSFNTSNLSILAGLLYGCGKVSGEITIHTANITNYNMIFSSASTSPDSKFIVKYIDEETKVMAEKLVATKTSNSNVFLWDGPEKPVTDGLICWLDGRDYVDNPGIWVDRSGNGNDFTLTSNTHWFDSNGVYFNGPDYSYVSRELIGLSRNNLTFEIGYKMADNASSTLGLFALSDISTSANNNSIFGYASYSEIRNTTKGKCRFDISKNVLYNNTFVCSEEQSTIYNNSDIVAQVSDINDIGNNLKLGGNKANGSNKLIIYYVRVYNRALTEEEIKYNYLYEKSIDRRDLTKTTLTTGQSFNNIINELKSETENAITKIEFTKSAIPNNKLENAKVVSNGDQNYVNCYAYIGDDSSTIYVSPEVENCTIYANSNCSNMFNGQKTLENIEFNNFNTSNVVSMYCMFSWCSNITTLNLSSFDTYHVTTMEGIFHGCSNIIALNLSSFNTCNVTTMRNMFNSCSNLTALDLYNFDTCNVTNMDSMFNGCRKLTSLDISNFNTSNVTNMVAMFNSCGSLTELNVSNFNTSNVVNMNTMFSSCNNLTELNLSNFNTSNVTSMNSMFINCSNLTILDLHSFDTSKTLSADAMFFGCSKLNILNLSNFNTSSMINTTNMFRQCYNLSTELVISNSIITNYSNMFNGTSTSPDSKFIVKYVDEKTKAMAEKLVATKSENSNVFLWDGPEDEELAPVMDGLVCWLDARDGNQGDTIWKDRTEYNNNADLKGFVNNGTDGFIDGYIQTIQPCSILLQDSFIEDGTIQVVFKKDNNNPLSGSNSPRLFQVNKCQTYFKNATYNLGCVKNGTTKTYDSTYKINDNTLYTLTLVQSNMDNTFYINGEEIFKCSFDYESEPSTVVTNTNGITGKIYSVLRYNRALTEEEIKHNFKYEQTISRGE